MTHKNIGIRAALLSTCLLMLSGVGPESLASPSIAQGEMGAAQKCAAMVKSSFGELVSITSAEHMSASPAKAAAGFGGAVPALPSHCRVAGVINQRTNAEGKTYGIGFAISLPDDWSGRFLLQGGGGLNGSVADPIGPVASGTRPALARGFAVITSDSGHEGAAFDDGFLTDQRAALDFSETAIHTVATLGKEMTAEFYGEAAGYDYMTGCSTGGREGMLASQRYPELFDGIIVGAPAMRSGDSNLGQEYTGVLLNDAAPRDEAGLPIISEVLTQADRDTLIGGILDQCDTLDGLEDGMIENVAQCDFDPSVLQCEVGEQDGCLSAGQVTALAEGFAGPKDKAGYPIYTPVAFDTGVAALPIGYLPTGGPGIFGPASTATEIDLDARIHALRNTPSQRLIDTNYWTNLNTFLEDDSKILFYHGVSDFWFSPFATWDYYQRATKDNGAAFTDASRFYMVPGMLHCGGGNAFDQFDLLDPLVEWVEKDQAPMTVVASRSSAPDQQRPLCNYPEYAAYTGGDKDKAGSFTCTMPQSVINDG